MGSGNNMENKAPGTTTSGVTEMTTEGVVVTGAEPVVNEVPKGDIVLGGKPKKKTGVILGMILLFLLAACGIGFGIFAWIDGNAQRDNLNSQVNALKEQNSKLLEQLGEEGEDMIIDVGADTDTNTDADANSSVNTGDYIYIGELGIKIKKPENWRSLVGGYDYNNGYPQSMDGLRIIEKGSSVAQGGFVDIYVQSRPCEEQDVPQDVCFVVGDAVIIVSNNGGAISDEFWGHFMNSENYSKI